VNVGLPRNIQWQGRTVYTGGPPLFRSYSLSGPVSPQCYRISVKVERGGMASAYLQQQLRVHDRLEVSSPRGSFILESGDRLVVLLSAGIGATPALAMLYALSAEHSPTRTSWKWRKPVTCRSVGRVEPGFATIVKADWSAVPSVTAPNPWSPLGRVTCCCAARGRLAIWSWICNRYRAGQALEVMP
jgi:hypothetical protein